MLLYVAAQSLQANSVSYEDLKTAYDSGMNASIILNMIGCKKIPTQIDSHSEKNIITPWHEHNYEGDSARIRFNIDDRTMLRTVDNVEALYIWDSYRVPHAPKQNDTSIGPFYDVAVHLHLYDSQEVRYFLKAQSLDQSKNVESIYHCPWSSLTINVKD